MLCCVLLIKPLPFPLWLSYWLKIWGHVFVHLFWSPGNVPVVPLTNKTSLSRWCSGCNSSPTIGKIFASLPQNHFCGTGYQKTPWGLLFLVIRICHEILMLKVMGKDPGGLWCSLWHTALPPCCQPCSITPALHSSAPLPLPVQQWCSALVV